MNHFSKVNIDVISLNNSAVMPKHIMIKLLKSKEKEVISKIARKKLYLACTGKKIQITVYFPSEKHGGKKEVT